MRDAAGVRCREATGELQGVGDRAACRESASLEAGPKRVAVNQFHDDERRAGLVAEFVDRKDVGTGGIFVAGATGE
jgi:hypothetical protein